MKLIPCRAAFILFAFLVSTGLHASLRLEIVDDTGRDDVHVLFRANDNDSNGISPSSLTVADGTGTVDATLLSSLPAASSTVVSPYTGKTLTPRLVTVDSIDSGVLNVSYGPLQSTAATPAPSPATSTTRFDQMEFTFIPGQDSVANLTSIDQFAIPLQLELFASAPPAGEPIDARYVYLSTEDLRALFDARGLDEVIYGVKDGELVNPMDADSTFVRLLGPQQVVQLPDAGNSPAPYSSFGPYLASLHDSTTDTSFSVDGTADNVTYAYTATLGSPAADNYEIRMTGTTTGALPVLTYTETNSQGQKETKTVQLPSNAEVTVKLPADRLDFNIYGSPLDSASYAIAGVPAAAVDQNSNTTYSAMVRDVLSALNFGFVGGTEGSGTADWFSEVVPEAPFGAARPSADGYYNPWAALFYNHSDAYGFAFSDRNLPSPAVSLEDGYTLRVTILPDNRLSSPLVTSSDVSASANGSTWQVNLNWNVVPGAEGYEVQAIEPSVGTPVAVASPPEGKGVVHTVDSLERGVPYTFRVYSVKGSGAQQVRSAYREITVFPPNQQATPSDGDFTYQVTFNTADADKISHVMIDDIELTLQNNVWLTADGVPARPKGSAGDNRFVVQVFTTGGMIYAGAVDFSLATDPSEDGHYTVSGDSFPIFGNAQPVILTNPNQSPFESGVPAVFAVTFSPVGTKTFTLVTVNAITAVGEAIRKSDFWFVSPWLGWFWHQPERDGNHLFTVDLGWVYVTPDTLDESAWIWVHALGGWYFGGIEHDRWLYGMNEQAWIYVMPAPGGAFVFDTSTAAWRFVARVE